MAVYIIVALVAVAVLWAAYRAFGSATAGPPDNAALLRQALRAQRDAEAALDASTPAKPVLRTLDGIAQLLERVDAASLDDAGLTAHALLSSSNADLSWAAKLREAATSGSNPALREAADGLRDHARRCLVEAERLLPSAAAEEVRRLA